MALLGRDGPDRDLLCSFCGVDHHHPSGFRRKDEERRPVEESFFFDSPMFLGPGGGGGACEGGWKLNREGEEQCD